MTATRVFDSDPHLALAYKALCDVKKRFEQALPKDASASDRTAILGRFYLEYAIECIDAMRLLIKRDSRMTAHCGPTIL